MNNDTLAPVGGRSMAETRLSLIQINRDDAKAWQHTDLVGFDHQQEVEGRRAYDRGK